MMKRARAINESFDKYVDEAQTLVEVMFIPVIRDIIISYLPPPGYLDFYDPKTIDPIPSNMRRNDFRFDYNHITMRVNKYTLKVYDSKFQVQATVILHRKTNHQNLKTSARCCNSKYLFYLHQDGHAISVYHLPEKRTIMLDVGHMCHDIVATDSYLYLLSFGKDIHALDLSQMDTQTNGPTDDKRRYVFCGKYAYPLQWFSITRAIQMYATPTHFICLGEKSINVWSSNRLDWSWPFTGDAKKIRIIGCWNQTVYVLLIDGIVSLDLKSGAEITRNSLPPNFNSEKYSIGACRDMLWVLDDENNRTSYFL